MSVLDEATVRVRPEQSADASTSCGELFDERTLVSTRDTSLALGPLGPLGVDIDVDALALARQKQKLLAEMFGVQQQPPKLGHYELLDELGRGGMGVVHAAHDAKLDRKVAIKQLREDTTSTSLRRRFASEARAMAQLAHPNVVSVYEIGDAHGAPFIVMEYIEGLTLRAWLREHPPLSQVVEVLHDAGRGLAAAHAKGMVHRDFKPANVMVGDDGRVRVMDFGLARSDPQHIDTGRLGWSQQPTSNLDLTARGALVGTPAYMAPEQLRGSWADARSDQFAYCVTFYEALYGERPFCSPTLAQLRARVEAGQVPPAPRHSPVPAWLRELILRGLRVDPRERFETMQTLLAALDAGLQQDGVLAPTPAYTLAVHAGTDKIEVLRLCASLLDQGVRTWLDMWELPEAAGGGAHMLERLRDAPALLVCRGAASLAGAASTDRYSSEAFADALRERIEADPSSVHHVRLPRAPPPETPSDEHELEEASWSTDVATLARQIGRGRARERWLPDEARRTGLPPAELSPYRGLEAFGERDARWMFGREHETEELLAVFNEGATRFMTLVGASGSGKSSLVKGGLCPALRCGALPGPRWEITELRPGSKPCEALARALVGIQARSRSTVDSLADALLATQLHEQLLASSETTGRLLRHLASTWGQPTKTLLIVDQLEELFTAARLGHTDASPEAAAFVENLVEAAQPDGPLWIVATLRADFVQRALEVPALAQVLKNGTYFALPPMNEQQLRETIERPAQRVGFEVEPRLVEKLLRAATGRAGQLPLLQHVMRELWLLRDEARRLLPHAAYAETGGLEGAIAMAAERALARLRTQLGERSEVITRRVMTRLVHLGAGEAGHTRRRVEARELGTDEQTRLVLETFIRDARVLVAGEVGGEEVLEIAHEALLREWSTLVTWLEADRDALRLRQELSEAAHKRLAQDDDEYLWGRGRIEEAQRILGVSTVELNPHERSFVDDSLGKARRDDARLRAIPFVVLLAITVPTVGLLIANQSASTEHAEQLAKVRLEKQREAKERLNELRLQVARADANRAINLIGTSHEREALALALVWIVEFLNDPDEDKVFSDEALAALEQVLAEDAIVVRADTVFEGHQDDVRSLDFSPRGDLLASSDAAGTIYLWPTDGGPRRVLLGHETGLYVPTVDFSPNGQQLLSASYDGSARIWSVATGKTLAVLRHQHPGKMAIARYSPTGATIATADKAGVVRLWSAAGKPLFTLPGDHTRIYDLDFSPDGRRLVTANFSGEARVWNVETGALLHRLRGHEGLLYSVRYAPNGRTLTTAGQDHDARIWNADTGELTHTLEGHTQPVFALSYSADSGRLVTGSFDHDARVWNVVTGNLVQRLEGHENGVSSVGYLDDGSVLTSSQDYELRLWNPERGTHLATFEGHVAAVYGFAVAPDGSRIASGGMDMSVRLWRPHHDRLDIDAGHAGFIYGADVGADQRGHATYATASHDGEIKLWNAASAELRLTLPAHEGEVSTLQYRPVGPPNLASVGQDGMLMIWDPVSGERLHAIKAHQSEIHALSYAPDGHTLATGSDDRTAKLWDASSGELIAVFAGHEHKIQALHFAPDGSSLATASFDETVRIWDLETGMHRLTLGSNATGHESWVRGLDYSPDSRRLVTASRDGLAIVWDVDTGEQLATCTGHEAEVFSVVYSPDGQRFATASYDGTVRLWDEYCDNPITLRGHVGRINSLDYSSDGEYLVTASDDGTARLWDPHLGSSLGILAGHDEPVSLVRFAADDARLLSASEDHTAKVWDVDSQLELMALTSRYGRRQADGSLESVSALELACMGCARLAALGDADEAVEGCTEVLDNQCQG